MTVGGDFNWFKPAFEEWFKASNRHHIIYNSNLDEYELWSPDWKQMKRHKDLGKCLLDWLENEKDES